jgi:hypothetical protein
MYQVHSAMLHGLKKLLQNIFFAHFGPVFFNFLAVENYRLVRTLQCLILIFCHPIRCGSSVDLQSLKPDWARIRKRRTEKKDDFSLNDRIERRGNSLDHVVREQWESSSFPEHVVRYIEPVLL